MYNHGKTLDKNLLKNILRDMMACNSNCTICSHMRLNYLKCLKL